MTSTSAMSSDTEARRKRARRSAWVLGGVALLVYVAFFLTGVVGR